MRARLGDSVLGRAAVALAGDVAVAKAETVPRMRSMTRRRSSDMRATTRRERNFSGL